MSDKIKVLVVEPMKPCEVREISGLEEMQAIVGGHIQAVYPYQDDALALVCNEEGKYLDLPYNRPLTNDQGIPYDIICGTFFLAGVGAEDFVSLTDEQIEKFSALYDNMIIIPAEKEPPQAEISPDDGMSYFAIGCQISFRIPNENQWTDTQKKAFADHVTEIFNSSDTLSERMVSELSFSFHGRCVEVEYSFADRTTDKDSAEAFSEECVRSVQDQLEGYGCKIEMIDCYAQKLEDDWSYDEDQSKDQKTQEKKKGRHHER